MLHDTLGLLLRAGAPEELVERPLHLYMDSDTGELHGDHDCIILRGEVEVVAVEAYSADGCDCVTDALDGEKDLAELVDLAEIALDLEERIQSLETWPKWIDQHERVSAIKLIHDNLVEGRQVLEEFQKHAEKASTTRAWFRKWVDGIGGPLDAVESAFLQALRSEENTERVLSEAVVRLFTEPRTGDEAERTRVDLGEEALAFFGLELERSIPQIEWELREAYGWAVNSKLTGSDRQEKLRQVLLKWRPETLTSNMFPFVPTSHPREGQTIENWLQEVWAAETENMAAFIDRVLTGIHEGVRTQPWLALLQLEGTRDGLEEALVYQVGTQNGQAVLQLPEAVAHQLRNLTSSNRGGFQAVKLEEGDTPEIVEITLGLHDWSSEKFRYLHHALEAARLV